MKKIASIVRLIGVVSSAFLSTQLIASGYHFGVQSVSAQGVANAGGAAAQDATTIFYNPAGLTYLPGMNITGALIVVDPRTKVSNVSAKTAPPALASVSGANFDGSATSTTLVPQLYYTQQINDQVFAGVGLFVPFGDKTSYSDNWVGRYNAVKLNMQSFALNPQIGYKVNDQFSIGLGLSAQYMNAEFRKSADFGTRIGGKLAAAGQPPNVYKPFLAGNGMFDGALKYKGHDWGFGWNIGAMWQVDPTLRFGAAYRSSISQTLSGGAEWTLPNNVSANILAGVTADGYVSSPNAKVKVKTPDSFSLNVYKELNPQWAVMGDWTHTRHSKFQELRLKFSNNIPDAVIKQNWKNTNRYALGATYRASDTWLVRFGLAYDQTPIRSNEFRIAGLPDSSRVWYSIGANYALTKNTSIDLAYTYVNIRDASMNNKECSPNDVPACTGSGTTTQANFKSRANLFGLQVNHRF